MDGTFCLEYGAYLDRRLLQCASLLSRRDLRGVDALLCEVNTHYGCIAHEIARDLTHPCVIRICKIQRDQAALDFEVYAPETIAILGTLFSLGVSDFTSQLILILYPMPRPTLAGKEVHSFHLGICDVEDSGPDDDDTGH